ncbi:PMS1 protein homolog 1-like [Crassostrea virginica]
MAVQQRSLHELPKDTVRLLGSSQVITSVFSVVKELIENSLDAGSTSLELRLENYGLDKIELKDNGTGIPPLDVPFVAKKYHTSKITSFSDLEGLETYGFRGEALGSLCNVSNLSITTRTKEDEISSTYSFNYQGQITSSRPSHLGIGTTITAVNLFKNLPVRRQFYNTNKKKKDELKRIEDLLISYGIISPSVRISLRHNKETVWQKNPVPDVKTAILETLGKSISCCLQKKELSLETPKVDVDVYLPAVGRDWSAVTRSACDRGFVFVNHRPVQIKEIEKILRRYMGLDKGRYPVFILSIVIPPTDLDVNVEPNKTKVFLHRQEAIMDLLEGYLKEIYDPIKQLNKENHETLNLDNVDESPTISKSNQKNVDNESNNVPMKTIQHQVKVIANGDESLMDKTLPVFNIVLDQGNMQTESNAPLLHGDVQNVRTRTDISIRDEPENSSAHEVKFPEVGEGEETVGEQKTSSEELETGNSDYLDMPDVPINIVTPEEPKERSDISKRSEVISPSDEFMDDSLSELLSVLPEKGGSELAKGNNLATNVSCDNQSSEMPSGEQWSRGQGLKSSSGKVIEPVSILNPGKRPLSPVRGESPPEKRRSLEVSCMDSRAFSTPQKENAFKLFSKTMTPKVITDNPESSEDRISELVGEAWDDLSLSEKTTYELRAGIQNLQKGGNIPAVNQGLKVKVQRGQLSTTPSIKEQLRRISHKHSIQAAETRSDDPRAEKSVPFSIRGLRERFSSGLPDLRGESQMIKESGWELIGPLKSCGMWTCYHDFKIHILNPHRVHETVLYHQLIREHVLPTEALEQPIKIDQNNLGDLWTTFRNLAENHKTTEMYSVFQDKRFTSNGIHIKLYFDAENHVKAELYSMAPCIPTFGVSDVREILELINTTETDSVAGSRPLKVINYLKSEAVRMARQLPRQQDFDDMLDLLCQMEELLPKGCNSCLHDKQFLHTLYDLCNIPLTQYSQGKN